MPSTSLKLHIFRLLHNRYHHVFFILLEEISLFGEITELIVEISDRYTPRKLWCMGYTQGVTRRSRVTPRGTHTPQLPRSLCGLYHSWLPSTNHRPRKAWQSTLAKFLWVTPLGLGSLENKDLKCVGYVIERTRGAVGLWGKTQVSARVRSTSGEPRVVPHISQVPSCSFWLVAWPAPFRQSQAERKVGSRTQEVQERNSEG